MSPTNKFACKYMCVFGAVNNVHGVRVEKGCVSVQSSRCVCVCVRAAPGGIQLPEDVYS